MGKHKLVPVEPTLDMIDASIDAMTVDITEKTAAWIYEAMIAAAPDVQGEPVATIHADGSFVHVAWRIPAPSRCSMDVYTAPQPAEQQLLKSSLASDAAKHLTDWLEMGLCECGGVHSCGYYEVKRTRDALLVAAEQLQVRCEARDLRVRAEAINQAINNYFNTDNGPHGLKENLEWQAQRLRERAGEEEQSK